MIYFKQHKKLEPKWVQETATAKWDTIEIMRGIAENMALLGRARNINIIDQGKMFVLTFDRRVDLKVKAQRR